ncbi:hypothetical protein F5I97DRAFT_1936881 [Phlebopus sp. FC_14]|nr:hypothetical protein F5I97DRAFT_1936881 [Phlebopus sp. FC_14]
MFLQLLPVELITEVLKFLGYRDLLHCRQVCYLLHRIVDENVSCRYSIELAAAAMEDGPSGSVGAATRLAILRSSQAAWNALDWKEALDLPMQNGNLWELYGGVLAQSNGTDKLQFLRLPSHYREIRKHIWTISLPGIHLRDFTMDPSQGLLVLIARPQVEDHPQEARLVTTIHLRTVTTGCAHPLAANPSFLQHAIDVCGDRLAVHFLCQGSIPSELVVWNWKTGQLVLNIFDSGLNAATFLEERYLLVGILSNVSTMGVEPHLYVLDLECASAERRGFDCVEYKCGFSYPALLSWVQPLHLSIQSSPWCPPHPASRVPFSVGQNSRLLVITLRVSADHIISYDLFVLSSTIVSLVDNLDRGHNINGHIYPWEEWGPAGTRLITSSLRSRIWVCFVFGTRFATIRANTSRDICRLEVWDFNQLVIRRDGPGEPRTLGTEWCVEEHLLDGGTFKGEVCTRLPFKYSSRTLPPRTRGGPAFVEVMCSEDNLILVDRESRVFRILTF